MPATKRIAVFSIKGGVGKTQTTIGLARALFESGHKVGIHDVDVTGPKLPLALGMQKPFPIPDVDVSRDKKYPVKFEGMEVYSEAFIYEGALLWRGEDRTVEAFGEKIQMRGTGIYSMVKNSLRNVEFSPALDYLFYDLPPSSSDVTLSLFENIPDLFGCLIICQPTGQSFDDIERTLDMIKVKKLPLIGMIENMAYVLCACCRTRFYPFRDAEVDIKQFCVDSTIPFLDSIPLTNSSIILQEHYQSLARKIEVARPVEIWQETFKKKLETRIARETFKAGITMLTKGDSEDG